MQKKFFKIIKLSFIISLFALLITQSASPPGSEFSQIRAFTRYIEFDYSEWTLNAIWSKFSQFALNTTHYLDGEQQKSLVLEHMALVEDIQKHEVLIASVYTNPEINTPEETAAQWITDLETLKSREAQSAPLVEAILQYQTNQVLSEMGIDLGGQAYPPILFHTSNMPLALIISPRDAIRQDANISLLPDLPMEDIATLEKEIEKRLDVSALVVRIGGIGVYPTMVMQTTNLPWLTEVIAHEWTHNHLTLHPLGVNYETTPELRTMNETTANISGKEISYQVIEKYYPEILPPEPEANRSHTHVLAAKPLGFDFRTEMRETRVTVDAYLAKGEIDAAEAYMEQRRQFFWDNNYQIRRLNQAYFAFHGAYADQPGGAAGSDPVGPAVQRVRAASPSLAVFINTMSQMNSYQDLVEVLEKLPQN
jgi:hypothetical protein